MNYLILFCVIFYFEFITFGKMTKLTCNELTTSTSVNTFEVDFYLCTPKHRSCKEMDVTDEKSLLHSLDRSKFNPNHKTAVLIHGFLNYHKTKWVRLMAEKLLDWVNIFIQFLSTHKRCVISSFQCFIIVIISNLIKQEPMNVILVDWSNAFFNFHILKGLNYRNAALSTELAAEEIFK